MGCSCENVEVTICYVANMLGISFGSMQRNLKDNLNVYWILSKFMSHLMSM
jgi:hypothetical protein